MIKQICAFCGAELTPPKQTFEGGAAVSHGICDGCVAEFVAGCGQTMESFIDGFDVPVLVVNNDGKIFCANEAAQQFLSKSNVEIVGYFGGEVFGCVHASEPGGCGGTLHCKSCTVRRTVENTLATGVASLHVPAFCDLARFHGIKTIRFLVSTEKVGSAVVLRIDKVFQDDGQ